MIFLLAGRHPTTGEPLEEPHEATYREDEDTGEIRLVDVRPMRDDDRSPRSSS